MFSSIPCSCSLFIDNVKINFYFLHSWNELIVLNTRHVEHPLAGDRAALRTVLVGEVDHVLDTRLDDHFCTLVAWK